MKMNEGSEEIVDGRQYLTFVSAGHDYAIPIMRMKEIVPYTGSTKVPLAPHVIRGLINLRGRAIPVLDLSVRFGSPETEVTKRTCVLIVDLNEDSERPDLGILADSVSRVIEVDAEALEETPSFGMGVSPEYLLGMVKAGDGFIPIIDVEEVLKSDGSIDSILPAEEESEAALSEGSASDVDPCPADADVPDADEADADEASSPDAS
jgi:purine-binding chemotaxis protein CheW